MQVDLCVRKDPSLCIDHGSRPGLLSRPCCRLFLFSCISSHLSVVTLAFSFLVTCPYSFSPFLWLVVQPPLNRTEPDCGNTKFMTVALPCLYLGQFPLAHHTSSHCTGDTRAAAQARAKPKPAIVGGFGPAWIFCKPKPSEARPKPRLSSQAGPEHH
ncbi:hypothetical protein EDB19DRAFT_1786352 [Suillus lakei]|nr:hypothetical protein EDB19DRAFT_1786352 [Suillus lakei]